MYFNVDSIFYINRYYNKVLNNVNFVQDHIVSRVYVLKRTFIIFLLTTCNSINYFYTITDYINKHSYFIILILKSEVIGYWTLRCLRTLWLTLTGPDNKLLMVTWLILQYLFKLYRVTTLTFYVSISGIDNHNSESYAIIVHFIGK